MLALRGLLPLSAGSIEWAPDARALHVPQGAVLAPTRSLARQLMYPQAGACSAHDAESLLSAVGLSYLWEQHGGHNSSNGMLDHKSIEQIHDDDATPLRLSAGELQCLAIARVLRAAPDIVLLDEAFSAVPADVEATLLVALQSAGVTVVMVSHRDSVASEADIVVTFAFSEELVDGWSVELTG